MKVLFSALMIFLSCSFIYSQKVKIHVKKLNWVDKDLNSNEIIDSEVGKEVDAYYTFDLKKKKLHYINESRGIDKSCNILDYTHRSGIYTISYKDVYRFNSDIVWFPTAVIDVDNQKMNMVFPQPLNNSIGYDTFTDFDLSLN